MTFKENSFVVAQGLVAFRCYIGVFCIYMIYNFSKGDIVRLVDETKVRPDYLNNVENLYQIVSVNDTTAILSRPFCPEITAEITDITAVKIDGKEDKHIYYDPCVMAAIVMPGEPVPVHHKDYTYYLDANAIFPHNKTMRDFINENGFIYVHELQHFLREEFQTDDLKINI